MPSAQPGDLEVAGAGEGLAGMGQAGAVPTPALSLGRVPGGGDSAVGRSQTPREGGETGGGRGRAAAVSTPGKDTISRDAGGAARAPKTGCRVVVPHLAAPRGSGEGAGRGKTWGSSCSPNSAWRAAAWSGRTAPRPEVRLGP